PAGYVCSKLPQGWVKCRVTPNRSSLVSAHSWMNWFEGGSPTGSLVAPISARRSGWCSSVILATVNSAVSGSGDTYANPTRNTLAGVTGPGVASVCPTITVTSSGEGPSGSVVVVDAPSGRLRT